MMFLLIFSYFSGWFSISIGALHPDEISFVRIKTSLLSFHSSKWLIAFVFPLSITILYIIYDFPMVVYFLFCFHLFVLVHLAVTDALYFLVPLYPLLFWMLGSGIFQAICASFQWLEGILRFILVYLLGQLFYFLLRRSFGMGDVYFLAAVAFIGSFSLVLSTLKAAIVLAGIYALFCIACKKMKRKDTLPFIPFLSFSFYLHIYWKPWLIFPC